jgi:hypothetical protein
VILWCKCADPRTLFPMLHSISEKVVQHGSEGGLSLCSMHAWLAGHVGWHEEHLDGKPSNMAVIRNADVVGMMMRFERR